MSALYVHALPYGSDFAVVIVNEPFLIVAADVCDLNLNGGAYIPGFKHPWQPVYIMPEFLDQADVSSAIPGPGVVAGGFDGLPYAGSLLPASSVVRIAQYSRANMLYVATRNETTPKFSIGT